MVSQDRLQIAATDYYRLPEYEQHDLIQLIDGEVVLGLPPIPRHQAIVGEIFFLLMSIAKQRGDWVFTVPIEVYLDEYNVYEPDVLYLLPDSGCKIEEKRLVGPPNLVVEVLSPSTARFDRHQKYQAYEQHGVGGYWIVDPVYDLLEVWTLEDGVFVRQGAFEADDMFDSMTLGQTIDVSVFLQQSTSD